MDAVEADTCGREANSRGSDHGDDGDEVHLLRMAEQGSSGAHLGHTSVGTAQHSRHDMAADGLVADGLGVSAQAASEPGSR